MEPIRFTTVSLPPRGQFDAWRTWCDTVFDTTSRQPPRRGFPASTLTWRMNGWAFSRESAPASHLHRTMALIRRNSIDHWIIMLAKRGTIDLTAHRTSLSLSARVPFVVSLTDEMASERSPYDQLQLYLARDNFQTVAPLLDAARTTVLDTPHGKLLADYMLLLERYLPSLPAEDVPRLTNAVQAMLNACLAPSADRIADARHQINLTLREKVRRAVRKHLLSPSLGPDKLCQEVAISRSQLYRLLEGEGGVIHYIRRRRLSESFAILCDLANPAPIGAIAETLCFADASSFSRAFRREFGMSPRAVREAALAGLAPPAMPKPASMPEPHSLNDVLRGF